MAEKLIKCRACGKNVAKDAEKCPHCGQMTRSYAVTYVTIFVVLAVIFIGGFLMICKGCGC